jgi:endonuclease YncB( thermonuclease family)
MIRFARSYSLRPTRVGIAALTFACGLFAGLALGSIVPGRSAPAAANESAPAEIQILAMPAPAASTARGPIPTALPADVVRVIDGDTFEARVHVWPGLDITTKVRLRGIDAAELRARCPAELAKAEAARDALSAMLADGSVGVFDVALDKYGGRVVADARTRSIANVSSELLGRGLARRYGGGRRESWCD